MTALTKPTIKDMVEFFNTLPQDTPVVIEDMDTGWTGDIIHFEFVKDQLVMSLSFNELIEIQKERRRLEHEKKKVAYE
jgi:hypothetical protein